MPLPENKIHNEVHEVLSTDMLTKTTLPENNKSSKMSAHDIIPPEYHNYLHVINEKESWKRPLHQHHDYWIPLMEGQVPPFEPLQVLDKGRLKALKEYIETSIKKG
jgi:hypothetical protein